MNRVRNVLPLFGLIVPLSAYPCWFCFHMEESPDAEVRHAWHPPRTPSNTPEPDETEVVEALQAEVTRLRETIANMKAFHKATILRLQSQINQYQKTIRLMQEGRE